MTEWERIHGKIIKVTELDSTLIKLNSGIEISIFQCGPTYIENIISFIGWGIFLVALGLILAVQIMQSINYIMNY